MESSDTYKKMAGEAALAEVRNAGIVGLGHGSTAIFFVRALARAVAEGRLARIRCVACSREVEREAERLGLETLDIAGVERVDVTVDGADEVDPALNLIKGGGGMLLREKVVAQMSSRLAIVVHDEKLSRRLCTRFPVPVEVVPFAARAVSAKIAMLGGRAKRRDGLEGPVKTESGNHILDASFPPLEDPYALSRALSSIAGVVEHGIFTGLADAVWSAGPDGIRRFERDGERPDERPR